MINWYHRNPKVFYFPLLENMSFDQTVTVTVADECQKMFNEKCPLLTILHFVYFNKKLLSLGFNGEKLNGNACDNNEKTIVTHTCSKYF